MQDVVNCVDCKNMKVTIGYGGVGLRTLFNTVVFYGIRPPQGAGTHIFHPETHEKIGDWERTGKEIALFFNSRRELQELRKLFELAQKVPECRSFMFKGMTFDYTHYDPRSMEPLNRAFENVENHLLLLEAC